MARKLFYIIIGSLLASSIAFGQTTAQQIKPTVISGDVTAISDGHLIVSAKGVSVDVVVNDKTVVKKVSPENPDLKAAVAGTLSEIVIGDKVTVSGFLAVDGKSLPAR